jgi:lipoate---protein ligase
VNGASDFPPYDADEALISSVLRCEGARVRVYGYPEVAVVIGRGGKAAIELDEEAIAADGATVLRRRGGGCAVVLDPGNAIVSVALPQPGLAGIRGAFARISLWLVAGLERVGVPGVVQRGVSDLALGDLKIGGSCIYRSSGLLYYSTTLLVDPDLSLIERYLRHPPREPGYRRGRRHREFLGSLAERLGSRDVRAFASRLERALGPPPGSGLRAFPP